MAPAHRPLFNDSGGLRPDCLGGSFHRRGEILWCRIGAAASIPRLHLHGYGTTEEHHLDRLPQSPTDDDLEEDGLSPT